ncbi:MAG: penicillin-binding protein 1C [Candidatus Eremiobacterota bacterium]
MFTKKKIIKITLLTCFILLSVLFIIFLLIPLPSVSLYPQKMVSCNILDRKGNLLRTILSSGSATASWIKLDSISTHMVDATVAAEDKRFYSHFGIDVIATFRALVQDLIEGHIVSGGSTITQQLAGIAYDIPRGSIRCKIFEAIYAIKIDFKYSKKEIVELYLNRAPYGNQTYGIEGASLLYFGKPSSQLSIAESAFLASIPRSPGIYDPYRNFEETKKEQSLILKRMYRNGRISEREYKQAGEEPLLVIPLSDTFLAPHFCDFIQKEISEKHMSGISQVRTGLDLYLQKEVEKILKNTVASLKDRGVTNGAVLIVDNHTGDILVMAGSVDFFSHEGQVNACTALRQPGSTLKPFTYGLALEHGFRASDLIPDLPMNIPTKKGIYIPRNYDNRFHGPVRFRQALGCSYNIPAIEIEQKVGVEGLLGKLHEAGFESLTEEPDYYGVALTLGDGEVTLMELVRAYSGLAGGGIVKSLNVIKELRDDKGNKIYFPCENTERRIFSSETSFILTDIMADNKARVPAFGRENPLDLPFPCASKTGTSRGFRDNWTIGYTPSFTVGVWAGNFNADPMEDVSGITGTGPIFRDIMYLLKEEYPEKDRNFTVPEKIISLNICPSSGDIPGPYCPGRIKEYFLEGTGPAGGCKVHRMINIDRRTDSPASSDCPQAYIFKKIYEIYPPLYYNWMKEQGIMPSQHILTLLENPACNTPVIVFPSKGDIFKIDPVLRKEYQVIHMKAVAPEGAGIISWYIDGKLEGKTKNPFVFKWHLAHGEHTVQIKVKNKISEKIKFNVY